ncbi:MAG: XRE family transcriptional regulator [Burkholderiaceae bacterium]|nr:XRE family transcriptional regulator [Burkholderiaceae bacterium]
MLGIDKTNISTSFGRIIRNLRKAANLSQEELAFEADLQRNYISLIELGKNLPTIHVILKIGNALNIPAHRIVKMLEDQLTQEASMGTAMGTKRKKG